MITTILNSKNEKITFTTQQYQVGLYLIINDDPSLQTGLNVEEKKFHRKLRKEVLKQKDSLIVKECSKL